jgi:hypothetical protein
VPHKAQQWIKEWKSNQNQAKKTHT